MGEDIPILTRVERTIAIVIPSRVKRSDDRNDVIESSQTLSSFERENQGGGWEKENLLARSTDEILECTVQGDRSGNQEVRSGRPTTSGMRHR